MDGRGDGRLESGKLVFRGGEGRGGGVFGVIGLGHGFFWLGPRWGEDIFRGLLKCLPSALTSMWFLKYRYRVLWFIMVVPSI